ncbi:MAG: cyclopropane-fatty-acyl-phospholipid synthase family protein [Phycisphaerales bacterium]|nr:cyclopropane-fatty-acyl-phospholipid synthase family protein [Phycisphaerales bacterium]
MTTAHAAASILSAAEGSRPDWYEPILDRGLIPDTVLRAAIRSRLRQRIAHETRGGPEATHNRFRAFVDSLRAAPIAINTKEANQQHYELPPEFFRLCLGPRLKYSSALWPKGVTDLAQAEEAMLALTSERAQLKDGQQILELGCGWGSLTLYMAQRFPNARITAVSNSRQQREFILAEAARRAVPTPTVITADANTFSPPGGITFDRIVSVEMMEHMKNYQTLLTRIASWLRDDEARFFVHIFTHTQIAYPFEGDDWIGRYFFTGGTMPSDDLLLHFADDLAIDDHWRVSGHHYAKTARAWLNNLDAARAPALGVLAQNYGPQNAGTWFNRWRTFFIACEELWALDAGSQWIVSHYLFKPRR